MLFSWRVDDKLALAVRLQLINFLQWHKCEENVCGEQVFGYSREQENAFGATVLFFHRGSQLCFQSLLDKLLFLAIHFFQEEMTSHTHTQSILCFLPCSVSVIVSPAAWPQRAALPLSLWRVRSCDLSPSASQQISPPRFDPSSVAEKGQRREKGF